METPPGIEIRGLEAMAELIEAAAVLGAIWGHPEGQAPVDPGLLKALAHAGGYVVGAFADGRLIGASVAFVGDRGDGLRLHSHITGVLPTRQGSHVGLALKLHQRAWAAERGIAVVTWTFDPLIRRNAYFNLTKLGARVVGFEPDFYGEMTDAINAGDRTDRAVVHWDVVPAPIQAAGDGGTTILRADDDGNPLTADAPRDADVLRAWVPEDIVALRREDPALGLDWRMALRDTFGAAVANGYNGTTMSRDGWYRLERGGR